MTDEWARNTLAAINENRRKNHIPPLEWSNYLESAARSGALMQKGTVVSNLPSLDLVNIHSGVPIGHHLKALPILPYQITFQITFIRRIC